MRSSWSQRVATMMTPAFGSRTEGMRHAYVYDYAVGCVSQAKNVLKLIPTVSSRVLLGSTKNVLIAQFKQAGRARKPRGGVQSALALQ